MKSNTPLALYVLLSTPLFWTLFWFDCKSTDEVIAACGAGAVGPAGDPGEDYKKKQKDKFEATKEDYEEINRYWDERAKKVRGKENIPFTSISTLDKSTVVHIKFVADTEELGKDESFPKFICDPLIDDYIQGFTGKWYVVRKRTHDWSGRPGRSDSRFTIWLDRTDPPPKKAEGDCE